MSDSLYDVNAYPKCISEDFLLKVLNGEKGSKLEHDHIDCETMDVHDVTDKGNPYQYHVLGDTRLLAESEVLLKSLEEGLIALEQRKQEAQSNPNLAKRNQILAKINDQLAQRYGEYNKLKNYFEPLTVVPVEDAYASSLGTIYQESSLVSALLKLENSCEADHPIYSGFSSLVNGFNHYTYLLTGLTIGIDIKSCPIVF